MRWLSVLRVAVAAWLVVGIPLGAGAEIREGGESSRIIVTLNGRVLPPEEHTRLRVFIHEEMPSHRAAPICRVTDNDARTTFGLTGWQLPVAGLPFVVNDGRAPASIQSGLSSALDRAAQTWENADPATQISLVGTTTTARARYDGRNVIFWRALARGVIAAAYVWYDPFTGVVLDADMAFNTRVPWAVNDPASGDCGGSPKAFDVQAVATHEFGHWVGLDDLYETADSDLTMYGIVTVGEVKKVSLGTGDTLGALAAAP